VAPGEQDLRRFFDTAPVGMYRSTAAGRFVFVNPAMVALLGYDDAADVLALDLARDVYVDADERAALVARYRDTGIAEGIDVRWRTRSGEILMVRLYSRVVRTDAGAVEFDTTVFDVTELHEARENVVLNRDELEHTATTLGLLLGQIPAVLWTTDNELRVTSSGGAVRELLGSTPNSTIGTSLYEFFRTTDAAHPVIAYHLQALAGEVVSYDYDYAGKMFTARLGPRRSADGKTIGTIGTAIDVTASRQLERRMVDAQRAESLGLLAGGLAHDFNNLLVAMLGNADLALRDPPGSREAIANIRVAAMRAAELVQQLLAYAGGGTQQVSDVKVAPLIDELLGLLGSTVPPGVRLHSELPAVLPAVRADPSQLRQVVLNLVTNARDAVAARGGGVEVSARVVDHDGRPGVDDVVGPGPGTYLVISVTDDGAGVDPSVRTRIFDPFFTTKPSGHGLGLAAVLGIVRSHAGALKVESHEGLGTTFRLLLPASTVIASPETRTVDPAPIWHGRGLALVVDDEPSVRHVATRMLVSMGLEVVTASSGAEAIELFGERPESFSIVLLDLTMPGSRGDETFRELRGMRADVPIILMSGYSHQEASTLFEGEELAGFLQKPFRLERLRELVRGATSAPVDPTPPAPAPPPEATMAAGRTR
jgi:two-component system cell cycle sensor histidine kinase/response regulator CckA